jgi:hypothetical protein
VLGIGCGDDDATWHTEFSSRGEEISFLVFNFIFWENWESSTIFRIPLKYIVQLSNRNVVVVVLRRLRPPSPTTPAFAPPHPSIIVMATRQGNYRRVAQNDAEQLTTRNSRASSAAALSSNTSSSTSSRSSRSERISNKLHAREFFSFSSSQRYSINIIIMVFFRPTASSWQGVFAYTVDVIFFSSYFVANQSCFPHHTAKHENSRLGRRVLRVGAVHPPVRHVMERRAHIATLPVRRIVPVCDECRPDPISDGLPPVQVPDEYG